MAVNPSPPILPSRPEPSRSCAPEAGRRPGRHLPRRGPATCILVALTALTACAAPTEVIDLSMTPQETWDAMLRVPVLPLGLPGPPGTASVGPIFGYGCGSSASGAATDAVQQLQIKALRIQATAVMDVLIAPAGIGPCSAGYSVTASGTAVAAWGLPRPWGRAQ
jgi:hypothetical protein